MAPQPQARLADEAPAYYDYFRPRFEKLMEYDPVLRELYEEHHFYNKPRYEPGPQFTAYRPSEAPSSDPRRPDLTTDPVVGWQYLQKHLARLRAQDAAAGVPYRQALSTRELDQMLAEFEAMLRHRGTPPYNWDWETYLLPKPGPYEMYKPGPYPMPQASRPYSSRYAVG